MQETEIDYGKEQEELKETGDYFKPNAGKYSIKFKDNGLEHEKQWLDKDELEKRVKFNIGYSNGNQPVQEATWDISKSPGVTSLWGQLVLYANSAGGLLGKTISLIVVGAGKEKRYTVVEAAGLKKDPEEVKV